jgi:hypothetical protein
MNFSAATPEADFWCIILPVKKLLVIVVSALWLLACAKEVKKPTEDTLMAKEAIAIAEGMRKAYVKKDFGGLKKYCTGRGYADISGDIGEFKSVELEFTARWVEIQEDGVIHLNVSWKGKWTVGEKVKALNGMAVFKLLGRPLKVDGILRGNPFAGPQTLFESHASGNPSLFREEARKGAAKVC